MIRRLIPIARFAAGLAIGGLVGGVAFVAPAAYAQLSAKDVVDAAKASGRVGEQSDGYLGVVSEADLPTREAVARINAGRAEAYRAAAARTGATPAAAGEAAYHLLLARMAPGGFYRPAGGGWTRR